MKSVKKKFVCKTCKRKDVPFMAKGLCKRCYLKEYREQNGKRIAQLKREWYFKHHAENLEKHRKTREERYFSGVRSAVLERDGHRCVRCPATTQLTVHHKDRHGRPTKEPNNNPDNLETLCRKCHASEHRQELLKARLEKLNRQPKRLQCGRWSRKHDACITCGSDLSPHAAKGVCAACYAVKYRPARRHSLDSQVTARETTEAVVS